MPHRVKSPPEQHAVSVRFGIAEGPAVFRVLLRSAPPVGVSWRMAYTMETSRTTIACLLVEYSSSDRACGFRQPESGFSATCPGPVVDGTSERTRAAYGPGTNGPARPVSGCNGKRAPPARRRACGGIGRAGGTGSEGI